jgi:hypothetical protein
VGRRDKGGFDEPSGGRRGGEEGAKRAPVETGSRIAEFRQKIDDRLDRFEERLDHFEERLRG